LRITLPCDRIDPARPLVPARRAPTP